MSVIYRTCLVAIVLLSLGPAVITSGQRRQSVAQSQKERARVTAQAEQLRDEYIKTAKELQVSLENLLPIYEKAKKYAEARVAQTKELFSQGTVSKRDLDDSERAVRVAQANIDEVRKTMEKSNADLAALPTTAELVQEQIAEERRRRRTSTRQPNCQNWTLTASRHQRGRTVTVAFKLVCKY